MDHVCELLVERNLAVSCIAHTGNEETCARRWPTGRTRSAATGSSSATGRIRGWGTFPRYFAVYVRELGILSWEQAVRKMTSLPAQRLGFPDRGLLRPGMAGDVTCIDPETIRDTATYEHPRRQPEGIPYVLVNGVVVVDDGRHTGALAGRALRAGSGPV